MNLNNLNFISEMSKLFRRIGYYEHMGTYRFVAHHSYAHLYKPVLNRYKGLVKFEYGIVDGHDTYGIHITPEEREYLLKNRELYLHTPDPSTSE